MLQRTRLQRALCRAKSKIFLGKAVIAPSDLPYGKEIALIQ
ncbi:hypothetical protein [Ewingella americana]|nr:hypothetical protein [Ewingella americana]